MYYKLLNKTVLSSALIALICFSGNKALSQELTAEDQEIKVVIPASDDISFEVEDDIIPLNEEELIVPEAQEKPVVQKDSAPKKEEAVEKKPQEESKPQDEQKPQEAQKSQKEKTVSSKDDSTKTIDVAAKSEEAPKNETIKAPEETLENDFIDNFEINFNEEPEDTTQDLFEQAPDSVQKPVVKSAFQNKPKASEVKHNIKKDASNKPQPSNNLKFGDSILAQTNNDLFNQMSDIEKQTTLLSLELKRERIRNEVEAARAVRERAEYEKVAQEEAKKRQEAEWKNEQQIKMVKAQEELKQKEIELEKVKQRKALTAYMNSMLEQKQLWIAENGKLYEEIRKLKDTNATLRTSYKNDLDTVQSQSSKILQSAETARNNYERAIASLTAQNAQLRKRIESMDQAAKANASSNPFADKGAGGNQISTSADALIRPINIAKEYAIMEITGQGGELFVKLINKEGDSFVAKTGTILNTGHMIEEITPNYVQFDRNGLKDFLYTATSALSSEPNKLSEGGEPGAQTANTPIKPRASLISDDGLPSVGNSMFVK